MATITPINVVPHTRIENSIIGYTPQIGLSGLGVLVIIRSYLNQKTGRCDPSYATIAKKAGVDRSTIIRYVKKLKALNLLDPQLRFREDGGYASNQYKFSTAGENPPPQQPVNPVIQDRADKGSGTAAPPVVLPCHHPSGNHATTPGAPLPPKQSSSSNKKDRTSDPVASLPTEKQKTCPHPLEEIASLSENIIICNHCFALLDENPTLVNIAVPLSPDSASAECDPDLSGEPETKIPPVGTIMAITGSETPVGIACKGHQRPPAEEKMARRANPLVALGKWITACLTRV